MNRPVLSVNVNKYALLRNSRGRRMPDVLWAVDVCVAAGAHGITVHPRRDQRHVRYDDVPEMAEYLRNHYPNIEYNIECEPHPEIIEKVLMVKPHQCTLVPVAPGEVTSDHGFRLPDDKMLLSDVVGQLHAEGIRVSMFMDCDPEPLDHVADIGADRIELYTGPYAWAWGTDAQELETTKILQTALKAQTLGIGLNAGHDLDRHNLAGMRDIPGLLEVSIGHAQICRALDVGTTQSVKELLTALGW
jgi:pyridoxine 5-phosphate synthase